MSPSKDDTGASDNRLADSVKNIEHSQKNVVLALRPAVLSNKRSPQKRSNSPTAHHSLAKKCRRLESIPEVIIAEEQNNIPTSSSRHFPPLSPTISKELGTSPNGYPAVLESTQKKPRVYYTKEQLEWLANYYFSMPDNSLKSWQKASDDFESTWGEFRAGKVLRAKANKMGLKTISERSDGGFAVEMSVDELSDVEAINTPILGTPVAQRAEVYQVTPPPSPQGARNRELWLKDNVHKFQRGDFEVDWVLLADIFNDIFDMKKSAAALEAMWESAICKNYGRIRSL